MPVLPAAEKLPLAVRKNVRDDYENKRPEQEKALSELLGEAWTFDINPLAVWPYHNDDSYAKDRIGSCIQSYVEGVVWGMKSFVANYGDEGKKELNSLASKHQVGLEYDDTKKFSYCGPVIKDGRLVVLFSEKMLGTNCNYCLEDAPLQQALNEAPAAGEAKMSYKVRTGIKKDYEAKEEEMRKNIAKQINCEAIKLNPNFEANYAVLSENAKASGIREDWEDTVGRFTMSYFGGLEYWLRCQQFEKDDMLQEGFQEAISKNEIKMVVVKQLETKQSSYNEAVIKDGVLCLQTDPKNWGTNVDNACEKLLDQL